MARNQTEKYINQLNIREADYIEKQIRAYKFSRLKESLYILKRASCFQIILDDVVTEIGMIFKPMPVHESYCIKINEQAFKQYTERLNKLYIKVLDEYEFYIKIVSLNSWKIVTFFFCTIILFYKSIEKQFGFNAIPTVLGYLLIFWIYENRWKFRENQLNFLNRLKN